MNNKNLNKLRVSLFFVLTFFLLLSGFENVDAGLAFGGMKKNDVNSSSFLSHSLAGEAFANTDEKSVAVLFLFDVSRSVVGSSDSGKVHCPIGEPPLRKEALDYFLNVMAELPKENSKTIHVGVSKFGSSYISSLPLTSSDQLSQSKFYGELRSFLKNSNIVDPSFENSTNYSLALKKGSDELQKYANDHEVARKILILLSDGFDPNVDAVENTIASIPFDVEIYLAPVCPSLNNKEDLSFWGRHRIPSLGALNNDWLEDIFHQKFLTDALPKYSGWIEDKDNEFDVDVDGSASSVIFSYLSYSKSSSVKVNGQAFSSFTLLFEQSPVSLCVPQTYTWESSSSDRGFWWVDQITRPSISNITITPALEKTISNHASEISVEITSDLPAGEFQDWHSCFSDSIGLLFLDANKNELPSPALSQKRCEDGGPTDLCVGNQYGDVLEKRWEWLPPQLSPPGIINIVPFYTDKYTGNMVKGDMVTVPVYFQPEIVELDAVSSPVLFKKIIDGRYYFVIKTEFDVTYPNIFLTQSRRDSVVPNSCPFTEEWRGQDVHKVPQSMDNNVFARVMYLAGQSMYELEIAPKAFDCGFDSLIFSWQKNNTANVLPSDYICNLKEEKCDLFIHK